MIMSTYIHMSDEDVLGTEEEISPLDLEDALPEEEVSDEGMIDADLGDDDDEDEEDDEEEVM